MGLSCRIENDGSLTVYNESTCLIKNMYPGIDGHPVHALQIIREDKRVVWVTAHGNIACRLPEADENCFALEYALENYEVPFIFSCWRIFRRKASTRQRKEWERTLVITGKKKF